MRIETDDWISVGDAVRASGIPQKTFYTIAKRLGFVVELFGTFCLRKKDVAKVVEARGVRGNPDWIGSGEAAAEAAMKAVKSRLRRIDREGMTEAEANRGARIRAARAKSHG